MYRGSVYPGASCGRSLPIAADVCMCGCPFQLVASFATQLHHMLRSSLCSGGRVSPALLIKSLRKWTKQKASGRAHSVAFDKEKCRILAYIQISQMYPVYNAIYHITLQSTLFCARRSSKTVCAHIKTNSRTHIRASWIADTTLKDVSSCSRIKAA